MTNYIANVLTSDGSEMELLTNDFKIAQALIKKYTGQEPEDVGTMFTVISFDGLSKGTIFFEDTF